jgi:hypothetical protein
MRVVRLWRATPGGDLSGRRSLRWLDQKTGRPVRVSTAPADVDAVQLAPRRKAQEREASRVYRLRQKVGRK